jgi:hypothetical protein
VNDKLDFVVRAAFLPFDIGAMLALTVATKIINKTVWGR